MILRELEKAVKKADENRRNKRNTEAQRSEWHRRHKALLKIAEFVKRGNWANENERKKVIAILSKGYEQAGVEYGVTRQALYKTFKRANSKLDDYIPDLTIRLIMRGYISAGLVL